MIVNIFYILLMLLAFSCSLNNNDSCVIEEDLVGDWELVSTCYDYSYGCELNNQCFDVGSGEIPQEFTTTDLSGEFATCNDIEDIDCFNGTFSISQCDIEMCVVEDESSNEECETFTLSLSDDRQRIIGINVSHEDNCTTTMTKIWDITLEEINFDTEEAIPDP